MATPEPGNKNRQRLPKPEEIKTGSKEEVFLLENKLSEKITQLLPDIKAEHLPLLKKALAEMLLSEESGSTEIEFRNICDWDLGGKVVRIRPTEFKQFVEKFYTALFPKGDKEQTPTVAEPVATHQSKDAPLELQEKIETNKDALLREEVFLRKLELKDSEIKKYLAEVEAALAELEKGDKIESFSKENIKEQMEALLKEKGAVAGSINIEISNGRATINIFDIIADGNEIKRLELKLKNDKDGILAYDDYTTHDKLIKKALVKGFLGSKIKNAPEELENYIQKNYKRGVKKIWIEGDELKVEFVDSRMSGDTLNQRSLLIPRRNELLAEQEQSDIHIKQQRKLLADLESEKNELGLRLQNLGAENTITEEPIDMEAELRKIDEELERDDQEIAYWEAELKKIDKAIEEDDDEIIRLENLLKENQEAEQIENAAKEKEPNDLINIEGIEPMPVPEITEIKEAQKDDLTVIEGIGPKIQKLLNDNGIFTYKDLAQTGVGRLRDLLDSAGTQLAMHDPTSWPAQANFAANEMWEELTSIQALVPKNDSEKDKNEKKQNLEPKKDSLNLKNEQIFSLYTNFPQGNLFYRMSESITPGETIFGITPDPSNPSEGTYNLIQREDILAPAFSMVDMFKYSCELLGTNDPTFKDYRVEKLGKVKKTTHGWEITEKLRLNWGE